MKTKKCSKCGKIKSILKFSRRYNRPSGYQSQCKKCRNENGKKWRLNNRQKFLDGLKNCELKRDYNITLTEYNNLLKKQDYTCAICRQVEIRKIDNKLVVLSVDHNHKTGKIRGLLCSNCNNGLGRFRDNINTLQNAIEYLKRN